MSSHQPFLTEDAIREIAKTTVDNLDCFESKQPCKNELVFSTALSTRIEEKTGIVPFI